MVLPREKVCAVGEADQTQYRWKGAKMKNDLISTKNFRKNWENSAFVRVVVPALLGILAIGAFVGFALTIAHHPWLALVLVFAVFAAAAGCKFHEVIDKKVRK